MRAEVEPEPAPACPSGAAAPRRSRRRNAGRRALAHDTTATSRRDRCRRATSCRRTGASSRSPSIAGRFAFTTENRDACIWAYGRLHASRGASSSGPWRMGAASATEDAFLNTPGEFYTLPVEPLPRPAHADARKGRDLSRALCASSRGGCWTGSRPCGALEQPLRCRRARRFSPESISGRRARRSRGGAALPTRAGPA